MLALARITFGRGIDVRLSESELDQLQAWLKKAEDAINSTGYLARLPYLRELRAELALRRESLSH